MSIKCAKCGKFKANNPYDICTICWVETKSPTEQAQWQRSALYKAVKYLQDNFHTEEELLRSASFEQEANHNDFSNYDQKQLCEKAIDYIIRDKRFYYQYQKFVDGVMKNQSTNKTPSGN